ncbi:MAG: phage holin family protein [Oscillospiraceae bacterium]|nr:phage holin family protein [Oscillospiraceae bacterium]
MSILENLAVIGVPLPGFLTKIIGKLKQTVDDRTEDSGNIL